MATKQDIITRIAKNCGLTKASAAEVCDEFVNAIQVSVEAPGDKLTWKDFGTFERVATPARTGRNPATGAEIQIPAGSKIKFKGRF